MNRIADVAQSAGTPRQEARRPGFRSALSLAAWTASIVLLLGVRPAHAYLDPGNGSMLLQLLLGGVAGLAVMGRLAWQRIVSFFRPGPSPAESPKPGHEGDRPENGAN